MHITLTATHGMELFGKGQRNSTWIIPWRSSRTKRKGCNASALGVPPAALTSSNRKSRQLLMISVTSLGKPNTYAMLAVRIAAAGQPLTGQQGRKAERVKEHSVLFLEPRANLSLCERIKSPCAWLGCTVGHVKHLVPPSPVNPNFWEQRHHLW